MFNLKNYKIIVFFILLFFSTLNANNNEESDLMPLTMAEKNYLKEKKQISFYPKMTQLFYSIILFFLIRLYVYFFLKYEFLFSTFPLELLFIIIPFGLTFISRNLHKFLSKSK